MQSKTSFSETSLFRRCLRRYWPIWVIMTAILVFWFVLPVAHQLSGGVPVPERLSAAEMRNLVRMSAYDHTADLPVFTFLFGLAAAMAVFEHVYSTRLTGLYASLPVKRGKIFRQHWLAGALMILAAGLVAALALLAMEAANGVADPQSVFTWFAVYALEGLTFYGVAVFCTMLTGHVLVIPALYLLINFAAAALGLMLGALLQNYTYGVIDGTTQFEPLFTFSPFIRLATEVEARYVPAFGVDRQIVGLNGWGWVIAYFIVGVILTVCALLLFLRRHNERAQETTAFPVLRPLLKYIVTVFFALGIPFVSLFFIGGFRFYGGTAEAARYFPMHLALTLLGAVIGYFFSEMIIHKSLRVFTGKGWLKALLVGLLCCGVVCLFRYDAFGIARRVPAAEDLQQIELRVQDNEYTLKSPEAIEKVQALHREILARQSESEALLNGAEPSTILFLTYALRDGSAVQRSYTIPKGALMDFAQETLNSPEVLSGLKEVNPPVPVDPAHIDECRISYYASDVSYYSDFLLSGEEAAEFYEEVIRPDVLAGHYGRVELLTGWDNENYNRTHFDTDIMFSLKTDDGYGTTLHYVPTPETEHTNAWLTEHGVELKTIAEREVTG